MHHNLSQISSHATVHFNLDSDQLTKAALLNQENATLTKNGALVAYTGERTGRSPKDRFIVKDEITADTVDWGVVNQPMEPKIFDQLWQKTIAYLANKDTYQSELQVGEHPAHYLPIRTVTELAWHQLFVKNMFIRPEGDPNPLKKEGWTLISAPNLQLNGTEDGVNTDGVVAISFKDRRVLLVGMHYAGEMKKSMFSVLNYLLPAQDILPMHCSANLGPDINGEESVALFFGLSGTGKTTLSADPERYLIGDDEHGWAKGSVFNFEGGCYAKCIALSPEKEPVIFEAIRQGTILENVVLNDALVPDYSDDRYTQNTRAAYPREHIPMRVEANSAHEPKSVVFLTCDLYGVLPPVSILTKEQAAYHFLSGYTALVGSTEMGSGAGIKSTFSTCFGAPFFPRPAKVYAKLLMKRVEESGADVFLVNTGWTGGAYGKGGKRFDIPTTRAIVSAIVKGELNGVETEQLAGFNLAIPKSLPGVKSEILNPQSTWADQNAYHAALTDLIEQFIQNFKRFDVPKEIKEAGPVLL